MYRDHVPLINAAMRSSPDYFVRGVTFAILSARQPFVTVPDQLTELDEDGADARGLFSWKYGAWLYVTEHKNELWERVCNAPDTETALWEITRVPGIGVVKGAFILQFLGHDIACLDTRNIKREGRSPRAYRSDGEARKTTEAFKAKLRRYIRDTAGQAERYWDEWCREVAVTYKMTADEVSALHLNICGEFWLLSGKRRLRAIHEFVIIPATTTEDCPL
jgi:hypothetical protein